MVITATPAITMEKARAFAATSTNGKYANIYIISSLNGFTDSTSKVPVNTIDGVVKYDTVYDFASNVNVSELGFGDAWDLTGEYPVFKTSEKVAPYSITMAEETATVYEDETITLTATAKDLIGGDASALVE